MTKDNYNTIKRNFSHLSDTQRGKLELLAKEDTYTQTQMASVNFSPTPFIKEPNNQYVSIFYRIKNLF